MAFVGFTKLSIGYENNDADEDAEDIPPPELLNCHSKLGQRYCLHYNSISRSDAESPNFEDSDYDASNFKCKSQPRCLPGYHLSRCTCVRDNEDHKRCRKGR